MHANDLASARNISIVDIIGERVPLSRSGRSLRGCCPFHADRTPSLYVYEDSNRYWCFGCGAGGNPLDFVMQYENVGLVDAAQIVNSGIFSNTRRMAPAKAAKAEEGQVAARQIWDGARPIIDTPAEQYLLRRGIDPKTFPEAAPLRFARLPHWDRPGRHPALVSSLVDRDGTVTGVQRTFLTDDGRKLDVDNAKLSRGAIRGNSTRLGGSAKALIVCEGLEDGLSIWADVREMPVWVAAGASNLTNIWLPDDCSEVIIAADNDGAGRKAADDAAEAFQNKGKLVRIMRPPAGFKDFNEFAQKGQHK